MSDPITEAQLAAYSHSIGLRWRGLSDGERLGLMRDACTSCGWIPYKPSGTRREPCGCMAVQLSVDDAKLVRRALGVYESDYNDAPTERIAEIRARLERSGADRP